MASDPSDAFWTSERMKLRDWLSQTATPLSETYCGAVTLLYGPEIPDRVRLICHCGREIINRLPNYVLRPEQAKRLEYAEVVEVVGVQWITDGHPVDCTTLETPITITTTLARAISMLINSHNEVTTKLIDDARNMFGEIAPENLRQGYSPKAVAAMWRDAGRFFVSNAHVAYPDKKLPAINAVKENFEKIEKALLIAIDARGFFEDIGELDAILYRANTTRD